MDVSNDRFCFDLPSSPVPGLKVLVSGGTGYIGGELVPELLARGYQVRIMVRKNLLAYRERWPDCEVVLANALNIDQLLLAMVDIDIAYYLIHSLYDTNKFLELDSLAASNFSKAAEINSVKHIIYLGSLGGAEERLSDHIKSRLKVANDLMQGSTPVTFLRAAVIVGSGSASYKMIRHIVRNCPIFIFPKWSDTKCQPIAIRDVIKYLVGCMENEETRGKILDIGGPDILSYKDMLKIQAKVVNKKRIYFNSSLDLVNLYARIAGMLSPISYKLTRALMQSCHNEVICQHNDITSLIPFQTVSYREALERALVRESQVNLYRMNGNSKELKKSMRAEEIFFHPPDKGKTAFSDFMNFMLHKPEIPTLVQFQTKVERANYSFRILQRLDVEVDRYKVLNIHKIGINAPAKYIFEELLQWDGESSCWPNNIAKIERQNNRLEKLHVYLFGWTSFPKWFKNSWVGKFIFPLFKLDAINILEIPEISGSDNARYMLYRCSGGYPIGIFSMYVRSSIPSQEEKELSQLFLIVGFNFYGKEKITKMNIFNRAWEAVHDRVTSNILNRIKKLSEWRFHKIQHGMTFKPD